MINFLFKKKNGLYCAGVGGNQMVLQNPGGTLVAMPAQAPQGIIYQQLADGRMIQLQAPSLIQPGYCSFYFSSTF